MLTSETNIVLTVASYLMATAYNIAAFSVVMPWRIMRSQWRFRASSQYALARSNKPVIKDRVSHEIVAEDWKAVQ